MWHRLSTIILGPLIFLNQWSSRTIDQKFVTFQRSLYHCCLRLMPVVFLVFCCLRQQGLLYFCLTTKRCFWQIWNWDDDSRQLKSPRQLRRSSEQPRDARRCPGRLETERGACDWSKPNLPTNQMAAAFVEQICFLELVVPRTMVAREGAKLRSYQSLI